MTEILPSILAADFARLGEQIAQVERGGATMLHLDVMDGHFVANLTIGPPVVASIRKVTRLSLDVHLMIADPDKYAPMFIDAGADQVSVHQEACKHLDGTLREIQRAGARAGLLINPDPGFHPRRSAGAGGLRARNERQSGVRRTAVYPV